MPVEREHQRDGLVLARIGEGLPDDLLVAEMHAVEEADGQADLAAARLQFIGGVDDLHGNYQLHRFLQMNRDAAS